ncbi:hypothetical protein GCM10009837_48210 [Streptomyces durmitorensis]
MPVAQLRRYDSADLADPRRLSLKLHRAIPAWLADHGCDSPNCVRKKATIGFSSGRGVCRLLFAAGGLVRSVIAGEPRVM